MPTTLPPGSGTIIRVEPRLCHWPIDRPPEWTLHVSTPMTPAEEEAIQRRIRFPPDTFSHSRAYAVHLKMVRRNYPSIFFWPVPYAASFRS